MKRKREYKIGDEVREKCSDFNGKIFLGRWGYVVDYIDDLTVAILWDRLSDGTPCAMASKENPYFDIIPTGNSKQQAY